MAKQEVVDRVTGEVLEVERDVNLPARNSYGGVMIAGTEFDVVGLVNVPTLKHETGTTVAFQVLAPIIQGFNEQEKEVVVGGVKMMATEKVPINVVRVRSIADGLEYEYVLNAIAADSLLNGYQDHTYVDRFFAIKKNDVVPGKRYKDVEVIEIKPRT